MQSYNKSDELIATNIGTEEELKKRQEQIGEGKARHVLRSLPVRNDIVEINGLKFKVIAVNSFKGKIRLRILRP